MSWLWLLLSIACEVAATLSMRASDGLKRKRWIPAIVVGYAAAFTALAFALDAGMPLGIAYGIWTAVGIVVVAVCARMLWKDPLTRRMLVGIALVAIGVLLVELGTLM
ncbi:DMT family transporter [Leucobacter aridicollis]|uniref:Small multidrug resistance pump n=1 Tax=Leucobacter aridicollis TaxID=283878 RepID=A0A852R8M7_9MICO|nr:SMR family transporter [Leucobacter aridicollis]MBL3682171.1 QacE family quaternary ammonium compound efflux SMR transporter [Leucobacter aridicollis]NYD26779.1 small multidrug resistance pump [Leucobacter aridicollis]